MPTTFYGKWSLQVIGNVGEFGQRVRIQGSLNADGNLNAALGVQIAEIDGAAWIVWLERSGDGGATWQENLLQRIPTVTPQNGLTFTLYGDDSVVPPQDSDVTVQFVYLDQQVNPHPSPPGFNFTLPPGSFRPPRPLPLCDCCCRIPCICPPRAVKGRRCVRCCEPLRPTAPVAALPQLAAVAVMPARP
jgi:hypothetical protein